MKKNKNQKNLLTLKELREDKAILEGELGEISLDLRYLPKDAKEKDTFVLSIISELEELEEKEKSAKELLNEILNIK